MLGYSDHQIEFDSRYCLRRWNTVPVGTPLVVLSRGIIAIAKRQIILPPRISLEDGITKGLQIGTSSGFMQLNKV